VLWVRASPARLRSGTRKWRITLRESLDNELVSPLTVQIAIVCPKTARLLTLG
jgi:hypothetical protein